MRSRRKKREVVVTALMQALLQCGIQKSESLKPRSR
jgi:hypothetical protein